VGCRGGGAAPAQEDAGRDWVFGGSGGADAAAVARRDGLLDQQRHHKRQEQDLEMCVAVPGCSSASLCTPHVRFRALVMAATPLLAHCQCSC
jgi:hypothetical protein